MTRRRIKATVVALLREITMVVLIVVLLVDKSSSASAAASSATNKEAENHKGEDGDNDSPLEYFRQLDAASQLTSEQRAFVQKCINGDPDSLYRAASNLFSSSSSSSSSFLGPQNIELALSLYKHTARRYNHIPSQAKLGLVYAEGKHVPRSTKRALHYFAQAAERGHHMSLYNAGHVLAEGITPSDIESIRRRRRQNNVEDDDDDDGSESLDNFVPRDFVGSLMYLQAASTLHITHPTLVTDEKLTLLSQQAHNTICNAVPDVDLSIKQIADVFIFGTLHEPPPQVQTLWEEAVTSLLRFNDTFVATEGKVQDETSLKQIATSLSAVMERYSDSLSELQTYLVLDNLNDALGPLAGLDDAYLVQAAEYAEALAQTPLCYSRFAVRESDARGCFNGAASSSVSYYRRLRDDAGAERVRLLANRHPHASTRWERIRQTPRVYHPQLTGKPWWDAREFTAPMKLKALYDDPITRKQISNELGRMIRLQEGRLRVGGGDLIRDVGIEADGSVSTPSSDNNKEAGTATSTTTTVGIQRIFTPYIGIRTTKESTRKEGAGGWAEFGPLYDGITWSEERCSVVPTICDALRDDPSLCTARAAAAAAPSSSASSSSSSSSASVTKNVISKEMVTDLCGSDTVITILRLRPGTSILPHCGTTNARLIMHFPLAGAGGIKFVVGDETVFSYDGGDGHPIVFDDSFEHHVYHEGTEDRFVVLAVLGHPDLMS